MESDQWTPDCLIPWSPERDGEDSERGDELDDEQVNPEDAALFMGVRELTEEEIAQRSARVWQCSACKQDVQATDWRAPSACWNCGGHEFVLATDQPRPDSDRC